MKLTCGNCEYEFLVHSGHYWRYPSRVNKCPQESCDGRGEPDEQGRRQIRSRNRELNAMICDREREAYSLERVVEPDIK